MVVKVQASRCRVRGVMIVLFIGLRCERVIQNQIYIHIYIYMHIYTDI